jgi:uncharacterized protein (DUF302 family)
MEITDGHGMIHLHSGFGVTETLQRLETLLTRKGIRIFCRIDHSGEAVMAGFTMRPTHLLIFGSPKAGTPLMIESPTAAIDLPLKALVWEDDDRVVRLTYNSADYIRERHTLQHVEAMSGPAQLFRAAVDAQHSIG